MEDLPKHERLRGHGRIGRFFTEGRRGAAGKVVVLALPNPEGSRAVAVVAGKKIGNAVKRTRMRRRLRAAYRTHKDAFAPGWDYVLMARAGLDEAEWLDVTTWTKRAAERALAAPSSGRPPSPPRR